MTVVPDVDASATVPDDGAADAEATVIGLPARSDGLPIDDEDLLPA